MKREAIFTNKAILPVGAYSQAIRYGSLVFLSGQLPISPKTNKLIDAGIQEETKQVMENIKAILEAAGLGFANVLKVTVLLTDINHFSAVNDVYAEYFTGTTPPARECYQVSNLPKNARVEISLIAGD